MSHTPQPSAADTYERMEALLCEMQGLRDELVGAKFDRDNLQDQRDCSLAIIEQLKAERDALRDAINALYEYATVRDHFAKDVSEALNGAMRLNCQLKTENSRAQRDRL